MAKNSIRDYSATNSSNTDIQSIDISEGCSPAGINNAIREVMADLKDVSTGAVALESPAFDSASLTGDLTFGDNDKAIFGAGSDLQIYHDGNHSYVTDQGDGNLRLRGSNFVQVLDASGNDMIQAEAGGAVDIYHNGNSKLATTATGVDVTGSLSVEGSGTGLSINSTNDEVKKILFENSGSATGYIGSSSSSPIRLLDSSATERMRLDSSGNVGIGTASPTQKLDVVGSSANIRVAESGGGDLRMNVSGSTGGIGTHSNHDLLFRTNSTERLRIDSSGNVLVGTTSNSGSGASSGKQVIQFNGAIGNALYLDDTRTASGSDVAIIFGRGATSVGTIQTTLSSTSYNTSSDYRLKENVVADWDATTRLKQLNPVRFNFIADADTTVDGFLAHEVQSVVPEAISGTKDAMRDEEYTVSAATGDIYTPATDDADEVIYSADVEHPEELAEGQQWRETTAAVISTRSVPDYQGIDQSKLVPLLVKTIQELEARITALEAN